MLQVLTTCHLIIRDFLLSSTNDYEPELAKQEGGHMTENGYKTNTFLTPIRVGKESHSSNLPLCSLQSNHKISHLGFRFLEPPGGCPKLVFINSGSVIKMCVYVPKQLHWLYFLLSAVLKRSQLQHSATVNQQQRISWLLMMGLLKICSSWCAIKSSSHEQSSESNPQGGTVGLWTFSLPPLPQLASSCFEISSDSKIPLCSSSSALPLLPLFSASAVRRSQQCLFPPAQDAGVRICSAD